MQLLVLIGTRFFGDLKFLRFLPLKRFLMQLSLGVLIYLGGMIVWFYFIFIIFISFELLVVGLLGKRVMIVY
jgi:hypothetical protein